MEKTRLLSNRNNRIARESGNKKLSVESKRLVSKPIILKSQKPVTLKASKEILKDEFFREALKNVKVILLQHMLTDTEEFIGYLKEAGADIQAIFGKPNSVDIKVVKRLATKYFIEINEYSLYDETDYLLNFLRKTIEVCEVENKKVLILEVGGYFVKPLTKLSEKELKYVLGVVEVTTFGHNRYRKAIKEIKIPVYSVARSSVKEVEAKHVGHAVLEGTNKALREIKLSIRNSIGLMIGYGMIGKSVVKAMKNWGVTPIVYDKSYGKMLEAFHDDIEVVTELENGLAKADYVFSSTGNRGLYYEQILNCKDGAILISAGSRTNEFDVEELEARCIKKQHLSLHLCRYYLENNKSIILLNNGKAANFLVGSCPDEIVDLIFAEVLICSKKLCESIFRTEIGKVNESSYHDIEDVAKIWLRCR